MRSALAWRPLPAMLKCVSARFSGLNALGVHLINTFYFYVTERKLYAFGEDLHKTLGLWWATFSTE